ncbi:MAG TPA: hypothetical protein VFO54_01365 [Chryseosolibacter sp.]|nr:hypothetical protein [Chryseosolibacter sp.]
MSGHRVRAGFLILLYFLLPSLAFAQDEVKVRGGFLSDSLKIGEETAFFLSAHYPSHLTILFPDSTHSFEPFEYLKKDYFLTQTTDGISTDSTVYYLTTFEVDRVQFLHLPVYVVQPADCTITETQADSVLITQLVAHVPDTLSTEKLPLKMNTAYQKVSYNFNFWLMVILITVLVAAALIGWILFGSKVQRYFTVRRLQKNHAEFSERYNRLLAQLKSTFSTLTTESALATWKKYMEQLEARPYTKLTTRETLRVVKEPALNEPLHRIDKAIYGHETKVIDSLENLKQFADRQFKRKMKEVQHG